LDGVTIVLSGDVADTTMTDSTGSYAFYVLTDGSYSVTPSKEDYAFSPEGVDVAISGAEVSGQDFEGTNTAPPFVIPDSLYLEFVSVAPGTFLMGAPDTDVYGKSSEKPQHEVTITKGFHLGKYEVTQGQWEAVMGTTPWIGEGRQYVEIDPHNPAVYVSWYDANEFVHKLNEAVGDSLYRLPTEAEWEYACRAGTTTRWSFGDTESDVGDYAWYSENTTHPNDRYAHKVGTKLPNPWGLYDMHGNVEEWCLDRHGAYPDSAQLDPTGPDSGDDRVFRGGGFRNGASFVRSAHRNWNRPTDVYHAYARGFRIVKLAE
jgi:formylglycine-generating enzyme required for sulfatase activity